MKSTYQTRPKTSDRMMSRHRERKQAPLHDF